MISPSRRPNPIPAVPPSVVRTPHLHGVPTTEETTRATIRLAESCDIVRMTSHRTSVASFETQVLAFGILFRVGPEQDFERL